MALSAGKVIQSALNSIFYCGQNLILGKKLVQYLRGEEMGVYW